MRFKVDENLPVEAAELLRRHGHEAVTVREQGLAGKPDAELAWVCRAEGRALVTLDQDFADVRLYPPRDYAGMIVLRSRVQSIPAVLALMGQIIVLLAEEPLAGRLWIAEEGHIRIRDIQAPPNEHE